MSIGSELAYQPTRNYYIGREARFEDLLAADSRSPNYGNFGNMLPHKRMEREFHGTFANENTSFSSSPWKKAVPYVPSLCMHDRQHPADQLTPEQLLFFSHLDTPRGPPLPLFDERNETPQGTLRRLTSVTAPQQQQRASPSTSSTTPKLPPPNAWAQSPDTPRPHSSLSLSSSSSPPSSPSSMHQSSSPSSRLVPLPDVSGARAGRVVSAVVEPSSEHKSSALPRGRNERNQGTGHQHLLPIHLNAMRSNSIG